MRPASPRLQTAQLQAHRLLQRPPTMSRAGLAASARREAGDEIGEAGRVMGGRARRWGPCRSCQAEAFVDGLQASTRNPSRALTELSKASPVQSLVSLISTMRSSRPSSITVGTPNVKVFLEAELAVANRRRRAGRASGP